MSPPLLFTRDGAVAVLTLNRPEARNALSPELACRLADAMDEIAADDAIRAVVLTGAGDKAFCAGGDLALSLPLLSGARQPQDEWDRRFLADDGVNARIAQRGFDLPKPVIAAVNGACMAGGMETLLGTDIRIAVPHATFALPEAVRGVIPFAGALVRLPRQIPYALAMEMMLTGTAIDAPTALNAGLIGRIVEPGALMETAMAMARKVAANAPVAVQQIKRTVIAASGVTLAEGYEMEDRAKRVVMSTEDAREGPRAFMEKRPAVYRGVLMLAGKVAVVTGAGLGIGRASALAFARAGAAVVVNDIDGDLAQAAVAEIRAQGGRAVAVAAAIGVDGSAEACVGAAIESFGRLDALFACAGVLRDSVLWKTEDAAFDLVVGTHLRGSFQCARAARQFRAQGGGGSLILTASPAGQQGNFGQGAYAAAKAGIVGMMRSWSLELARDGVAVNAIVPTALTRMTATIPALAPHVAALERGEPLPRALREKGIGTPGDVAPLVVFLASDAARGLTGQALGIGGDRLSLWTHPTETDIRLSPAGWSAEGIARALQDRPMDWQPVGVPLDFG